MRALFIALSISLAVPAMAQEPEKTHKADNAKQAEGNRLRVQLEKHAERNAWAGVERTWVELVDLGLDLQKGDYLIAAQAARTAGNAFKVRERLLGAINLSADMNTVRWITELQQEYGSVVLTSRKKGSTLEPKVPPFQPDRRQAIAFATERLANDGRFEGLLPAGTYVFGAVEFDVGAGLDTALIDLRKVR